VLKADSLDADNAQSVLSGQAELKGVLSGKSNFRVRVRVRVIKCVVIIAKNGKKRFLEGNRFDQ
jgi:hypothetical protein